VNSAIAHAEGEQVEKTANEEERHRKIEEDIRSGFKAA
jgi:hypothetical protein